MNINRFGRKLIVSKQFETLLQAHHQVLSIVDTSSDCNSNRRIPCGCVRMAQMKQFCRGMKGGLAARALTGGFISDNFRPSLLARIVVL